VFPFGLNEVTLPRHLLPNRLGKWVVEQEFEG